MSTLSNSLLKTLAISNTCFASSLRCPPIFIPKSLYFSNPSKPTKLPASLSLQKPIFSSTVVSCVAQTSDWEQGAVIDEVSDQEEANWGAQDFGSAEAQVSDMEEEANWGARDFGSAEAQASDLGEQVNEGGFSEPPEDAVLYAGNLPFDVDSERLAQIFEAAGVVEIAEVIYDRETDRSRGFGFVTMSTVEEAAKAVEMFDRYELNGRRLVVNKAAPRGSRLEKRPQDYSPSFKIYVGNLPWDVDNARLEQVFSEHGKVLRGRIVLDRETGRSRGFGFVTMASETEMNDAIAALDGRNLGGRPIRVSAADERPRRNF